MIVALAKGYVCVISAYSERYYLDIMQVPPQASLELQGLFFCMQGIYSPYNPTILDWFCMVTLATTMVDSFYLQYASLADACMLCQAVKNVISFLILSYNYF